MTGGGDRPRSRERAWRKIHTLSPMGKWGVSGGGGWGWLVGWKVLARSGGIGRTARRRLTPIVWRTAESVPLAIIGGVARVHAVLQEVTEKLMEREVITVDLWVRTDEAQVGGARRRLVKRSLVLVVTHGDVERHRVCPPFPVLPSCPTPHALQYDTSTSRVLVRVGRVVGECNIPPKCAHAHRLVRCPL
jgi:hypothetical protein